MFAAILENMNDARAKGDLYQGSVTDNSGPNSHSNSQPTKSGLSGIAQEALATQEAAPVERQLDSIPAQEPIKEEAPPLIDSFSKPESLGPEKEISPEPPQPPQPNQPPQHPQPFEPQIKPQFNPQLEEKREESSASFLIDNMNKNF